LSEKYFSGKSYWYAPRSWKLSSTFGHALNS